MFRILNSRENHKNLLTLYEILFTKLNQEGDAIWTRFKTLFAINLALYAAIGYIWIQEKPSVWLEIFFIICAIGVLINGWCYYVFKQLWSWHTHWYNQLKEIEKGFPENEIGWVRPITNVQTGLGTEDNSEDYRIFKFKKNDTFIKKLLSNLYIPKYTTPFIWISIGGWFTLFFLIIGYVRVNC